jgi:hypothetical protein
MVHRRFVLCVGLIACAAFIACDNAPDSIGHRDSTLQLPPPVTPVTPAVEGTVRIVGGGVLAGATVTASGVADSPDAHTVSGPDGHFALPSLKPAANVRYISVTGLQGYVSGTYPLPIVSTPGQTTQIDIHVQPELALADHMEFTLSNDDLAFGDGSTGLDPEPQSGLWPVEVIQVGHPEAGTTILAEWTGAAPITMWYAGLDADTSTPTSASTAVLKISDGYGSRLFVGLSASLGGLREPVTVRLTVMPPNTPAR